MTNYYRGTSKTESPFKRKAPEKKSFSQAVTKVVDVLLIVIVFFCLIYSLIVRPDPKVITNSGVYHTSSVYQLAAARDLKSFKDRNKLTFDEVGLVGQLRKQFPEISSANIELPLFGQKPVIRLSIATPEFLFISQNHKYLISADGVIVSSDQGLPAAMDLPQVNDQSGFAAKLGEQVLSSSQVEFIDQVVLQCQHAKVPIRSLVLPAQGQELDLRTNDKPYVVKFYLGGDPLVETGQFFAARSKFEHDHIKPSQYLDVRVAGKIYYK